MSLIEHFHKKKLHHRCLSECGIALQLFLFIKTICEIFSKQFLKAPILTASKVSKKIKLMFVSPDKLD